MRITDETSWKALRDRGAGLIRPEKPLIAVGLGTCGIGNGAQLVFDAFAEALATRSDVLLKRTGCFGFCAREPLVTLLLPGKPILLLPDFKPKDVPFVLAHLGSNEGVKKVLRKAEARIEDWDFLTSRWEFGRGFESLPRWDELPFFRGQKKIVLRHCGFIDPESLEEFIAVGGYGALVEALTHQTPEEVLEIVSSSRLRGRGGAGFPTGRKWDLMRVQKASQKYVICNADEGDPGAYMNRNEIESDPHMLIEGMAIGAYAMGASKGIVYLRAEYPLAVKRLRKAIDDARTMGILGKGILGTSFDFDIDLVQGAGAFVCGEETALIASIEGKAGRPSPRPPFPAQKGLYGMPTDINNVETWCVVPAILNMGAQAFAATGTRTSPGTKVFSLVGKVKNTGLVELPLGSSLEDLVYGMGEGTGTRKRIRAVQTGGPSGGCVPTDQFRVPVDYESLASLGAIMGSGGMVVMDQDNCMVDTARYFTGFTAGESCGKCTACREGLSQMKHILDRIVGGQGREQDLDTLEELALYLKDTALCGLGQTAANPVLTTLRHFRRDYEQHIREKRCEAGVCENLYLALCENSCPLHMNIPGYLTLLQEDRIEEAFELTLRENPLPGTVGRICHFHCQTRCRRETIDEPVAQGEIHRFLPDAMYKMGREKAIYRRLAAEKAPPTGKKVAIVGAGPAGLTAAFYLVRLGHEVTVYDAQNEAGGVLRWGIPAYRLPKPILTKEIGLIQSLGTQFVFRARVGTDLEFSALVSRNDAVLLCLGAGADRRLGIPGEDFSGVVPGCEWLDLLNRGKATRLGHHVVVIGGGNSAVDVARSVARLGSRVTVAYRRAKEDMPANHDELEGAEEEGITCLTMLAPQEILGDANGKARAVRFMKMQGGRLDVSGRRTPMATGQTQDIEVDAVVVAIGERVEAPGFHDSGLEFDSSGTVVADPLTLRTKVAKVWAAGDVVLGPATASEAMALARRAAQDIDRTLTGQDRFASLFRTFSYGSEVPHEVVKHPMNRARRLPAAERKGNFQEIGGGYTGEQAYQEASRCLRCDVKADACSARSR